MKSEPHIVVNCDRCQVYEDEIGLTALARGSYDERNVDAELTRLGWRIEDGKDICPECVANEQELAEADPETETDAAPFGDLPPAFLPAGTFRASDKTPSGWEKVAEAATKGTGFAAGLVFGPIFDDLT